jgi:hypothetical protein
MPVFFVIKSWSTVNRPITHDLALFSNFAMCGQFTHAETADRRARYTSNTVTHAKLGVVLYMIHTKHTEMSTVLPSYGKCGPKLTSHSARFRPFDTPQRPIHATAREPGDVPFAISARSRPQHGQRNWSPPVLRALPAATIVGDEIIRNYQNLKIVSTPELHERSAEASFYKWKLRATDYSGHFALWATPELLAAYPALDAAIPMVIVVSKVVSQRATSTYMAFVSILHRMPVWCAWGRGQLSRVQCAHH